MRGVLIGDSQLKFLNRSRLQFAKDVSTCTFSVGGANAVTLLAKVQQLHLKSMDFVVIYVGGNDLSDGRDPWDICRDILNLVELMRTISSTVFVFKVLPRCRVDAQAETRRKVLNRRLARGVRYMDGVVVINPDVFFLDKKQLKAHYYARDGYHVCRYMGVRALARLIKVAVRQKLGAEWVGCRARLEVCQWTRCRDCDTKGHHTRHCLAFRCSQH